MRFIVSDQPDWIGGWVAQVVGFEYCPGRMTAIGLVSEEGEVLGGVVFYDYTGTNIWMHVAVTPGVFGARDWVRSIFDYPFNQLNCLRVSGWVPAINEAAIRLDQKLGFQIEHILKHGGTEGDHLLMGMFRDECRWIRED